MANCKIKVLLVPNSYKSKFCDSLYDNPLLAKGVEPGNFLPGTGE